MLANTSGSHWEHRLGCNTELRKHQGLLSPVLPSSHLQLLGCFFISFFFCRKKIQLTNRLHHQTFVTILLFFFLEYFNQQNWKPSPNFCRLTLLTNISLFISSPSSSSCQSDSCFHPHRFKPICFIDLWPRRSRTPLQSRYNKVALRL